MGESPFDDLMADTAEEFIIRLNEQVSGPAKVAASAIAQLEARIQKQGEVVNQYQTKLAAAAAKMNELAAARTTADPGKAQERAIAAFAKQQKLVAALGQQLEDARNSMASLEGAKGLAAQVDQMRVAEAAAREKAAADSAAAAQSAAAHKAAAAAAAAAAKQEAAAAAAAAAAVEAAAKRKAAALRAAADVQKARITEEVQGRETAARTWNTNVKKHGELLAKQSTNTNVAGQVAKRAGINFSELGGKLGQLGGPMGTAGARAGQLAGAFQKLGAVGAAGIVAGIAVAVVALVAALTYAVVQATKFAITMADQARNTKLSYESLAANYKALADIASIGPKVASATGLATDEVQALAEQLAKAKVPAKNLETALRSMAMAKAGGASAEFLEKLQKALIATGKVPAELAEQFAKFQAIAGKKLLSLDAQGATFKSHFSALFSGLKIDGFLAALAKIVGLFDQSTASGRALRAMVEGLFQPLIDGATKALPVIRRGFLWVIIAVQEVEIALKKLAKALNLPKDAGAWAVAFRAELGPLATIAMQAASALNMLKAAMGGTAASAGTASAGVAASAARMSSAWAEAKARVAAQVASAGAGAEGKTAGTGAQMSAGMAAGILSGGGAVVGAISQVVAQAIAAAQAQLQSHSPSRVFWKFGLGTTQGIVGGTEEGAPAVQRAYKKMVAPTIEGAGGDAAAAPGKGGAGSTYNFDFSGATFGEGLDAGKLEQMLLPIFKRHELATEGT